MAGVKEWMAMGEPNAEWEQAVQEHMGGQAPDIGAMPDIATLRRWINSTKTATSDAMSPPSPNVKETDHHVKMRDGATITCRVYSPQPAPAGGSPLLVVYHGGGFCIGGLENEEPLCRLSTAKFGVTCVNVDYRLAPEHKFPAAPHDCHDAAKWAADNASTFGADASKGFVLAGTSAGGNLVGIVSHLLRDEGCSPPVTGALYIIPGLLDDGHIPEKWQADHQSHIQNAHAPILGAAAIKLFRHAYLPDASAASDPKFSPLLWPSGHAGLSPSAFQVCGADPLRDGALIFERLLREEHHFPTRLEVYPGMPHGFWSIAPMMKSSAKFVEDSVSCVGWLLDQKA